MHLLKIMDLARREKHHSPLMASALCKIINRAGRDAETVCQKYPYSAWGWNSEFEEAVAKIINNDDLCKEVSGFPSKVLRIWFAGKGLPFERV